MRKYEGVDIIRALSEVVDANTQRFRNDFRLDIERFQAAAANPDVESRYLLWLSYPSGTECVPERDAYMRKIWAHRAWTHFAETRENCIAYAVLISFPQDGAITGNLYELDAKVHAARLKREALPVKYVVLRFEDGFEGRFGYEIYDRGIDDLLCQHGAMVARRHEPEDEQELKARLDKARQEREAYRAATWKYKGGYDGQG